MHSRSNTVVALVMEVKKTFTISNMLLQLKFVVPGRIGPISLRMKRVKLRLVALSTIKIIGK